MKDIEDLITDKNDPQQIFQLLDILGQGQYGSVSKALHKQTGQLYAIKILPATSGVQISSIKKQIGILKQCNDDHIVKYFGSYFKENSLWIVMEYCVAGSVTDIMQITKKQLNQKEIASILQSVLKGLDYLHCRKKIHRDIKAANILLDQRGNAKLADFGVSASAMYTNARFRTYIGSPYWMSPQILKYSEYDHKTDIWSLGITAIQLGEGQVPNSHIKPFMIMFTMKTNPIQSFKEPEQWSDQFNDFVHLCLQINPTKRPSARELLEHDFIKKNSRGQSLLAELVLNSMEEIQQFRMNQSRNSSFAEIIIDEGRGSLIQTKTIVEKSVNNSINHKSHESQTSQQVNSMIVLSENEQGSMVINDTSVIMKGNAREEDQNKNILTNYINELKSYEKAQVKCIEMLVKNINKYDDKFYNEIEETYKRMRERAKGDIEYLRQLQSKEGIEDKNEVQCQIVESQDWKSFIYPLMKDQLQQTKKEFPSNLPKHSFSEQHDKTTNLFENKKLNQITFNEERRKQSRSYGIPSQRNFTKKQPFRESEVQKQLQENKPQANLQKLKSQQPISHNTSRIVFTNCEPHPQERTKNLKQFFEDPDVFGFLKQIVKTEGHTRSNFHTSSTTTGLKKLHTQIPAHLQKSTDHSVSKNKYRSSKNLKPKKLKTKAN